MSIFYKTGKTAALVKLGMDPYLQVALALGTVFGAHPSLAGSYGAYDDMPHGPPAVTNLTAAGLGVPVFAGGGLLANSVGKARGWSPKARVGAMLGGGALSAYGTGRAVGETSKAIEKKKEKQ